MICNGEHRYLADLEGLPDSQAGGGRHKCAGCAYDQGCDHAISGQGRNLDTESLNYSQAGTGRHKNINAAYNLGYDDGLLKRKK